MRVIFLIFVVSFTFSTAHGANFRDGSLSYLNGDNYKVNPEKQQTLTFEYVAGWDWGDMFMFVDSTRFKDDSSSYYGEFSPRIKLKEFAKDSLLSKIFFATTFERGKGGLESNLYGVGFSFNTDKLLYLNANIYQRNNPDINGKGYQLTSSFGYATEFGSVPVLLDGFFDWVFSSDESEPHFHFNPQLKIDMKQWLKTSQQWYLGIEYDYWHQKYGIEDSAQLDTQQNTFSFLVKWHF